VSFQHRHQLNHQINYENLVLDQNPLLDQNLGTGTWGPEPFARRTTHLLDDFKIIEKRSERSERSDAAAPSAPSAPSRPSRTVGAVAYRRAVGVATLLFKKYERCVKDGG
jgi:hypothetical protein